MKNLKLRWLVGDQFIHTDNEQEMRGCYIYVNNGEIVLMTEGRDDDFIGCTHDQADNKTRGIFIGIQDINGVDIYEGDIVHVIDDDGEIDFNHVVEFDEAGRCFAIEAHGYDYDWTTMSWAVQTNFYYYEVIGNIYQNPDLVKKDGE